MIAMWIGHHDGVASKHTLKEAPACDIDQATVTVAKQWLRGNRRFHVNICLGTIIHKWAGSRQKVDALLATR
jgi:hypothetical protein